MHERELDLDLRVGNIEDGTDGLHMVVDPAELVASNGLARHRHGLVTGLSVLSPSSATAALERVMAVTGSAPPEMRVELVLCDPPRSVTERLDLLSWPWSVVPEGTDRASTLDAATAVSSGEFVVIGSDPDGETGPSFDRLGDALGLMWVNGADAMVIDQSVRSRVLDGSGGLDGSSVDDARARTLATVLGLRRGPAAGLVILRRWVARFLFEELGRAIDPYHELTERIRLLELRLIEVLPSAFS